MLPGLSPEAVARTAIEGFLARQTVITPGMLGWLRRLGLKLLPRRMLVAFVRGYACCAARSGERCARRTPTLDPRTADRPASAGRRRLRRAARRPRPHPGARLHRGDARAAGRLRTRKAPHVDAGPRSTIAAPRGFSSTGFTPTRSLPTTPSGPLPDATWRRATRPSSPASPRSIEGLARTIRCLAASQADCVHGNPFRSLIFLQALLAFLALALVCRVARELSGSARSRPSRRC